MFTSTIAVILISILTITLVFKQLLLQILNTQPIKFKLILLASDVSLLLSGIYFYLIVTIRIFYAPFFLLISGFVYYTFGALSLLYILMKFDNYKSTKTFKFLIASSVIMLISNILYNSQDYILRLDLVYLGSTYYKTTILHLTQIMFNIIFSFIGLNLIRKLQINIRASESNADDNTFTWLKIHFIYLIGVCCVFTIINILKANMDTFPDSFHRINFSLLLMVILAVATTYGCIRQAPVKAGDIDLSEEQDLINDISASELVFYQNIVTQLRSQIEKSKLYLDPDLRLSSLANKVNLPGYQISKSINVILDKNFNEYINDFRIDDAKTKLISQEFKNITILAVALESGFNSKSSFNLQFKKRTSLTPVQFRSQNSLN